MRIWFKERKKDCRLQSSSTINQLAVDHVNKSSFCPTTVIMEFQWAIKWVQPEQNHWSSQSTLLTQIHFSIATLSQNNKDKCLECDCTVCLWLYCLNIKWISRCRQEHVWDSVARKTETSTHNVKQSTPSALQRIDLRESLFFGHKCCRYYSTAFTGMH